MMLFSHVKLYNVIYILLLCSMLLLSFHKLSILGDDLTINTDIQNNIRDNDDDIQIDIDSNNNDDNIGYSVDDFYAENNKYSFFFPKSIPIYNVRKYNHSGMI